MININAKEKCCGCYACMNICPKDAIVMQEDERGFKYPVVDKSKCINCGLCEKVCPIINKQTNKFEKEVFAVINNNEEERLNSSSGGIFILLAKEIIKRNGVVFGAAFDKDYRVQHIVVDKEKDLLKLQGSKYVQSNIGDSYKKAKKYLDNGKYVYFTGTSCQIDGLKSYLIKDYDKLYTQDIICHGVPSPKVWKKYLEFQEEKNGQSIKNISFRNKEKGWLLFSMRIEFEDQVYSATLNKDKYMQVFLKNSCLRDSCYSCAFKNNYRNSDITLGDYWGVKNIHPNMFDDKGTSIVIINSEKGKELFDKIKDNCIYEKSDIEYIYKYNPAYIKSAIKDKKYNDFNNHLENVNFDDLVDNYVSKESFLKKVKNKVKRIIKRLLGMS